jgi:hypothetical protein
MGAGLGAAGGGLGTAGRGGDGLGIGTGCTTDSAHHTCVGSHGLDMKCMLQQVLCSRMLNPAVLQEVQCAVPHVQPT